MKSSVPKKIEPDPVTSTAELDRLYEAQVRPDHLDAVARSARPTAVVIAGQPGTPKHHTAAVVSQHLEPQVGSFAVISGDYLQPHIANLMSPGTTDHPDAARAAVAHWYRRLTHDVIEKRANLVLLTSMRRPEDAAALMQRLKASGYETSTVVLAADRDRSLQAAVLLYEKLKDVGKESVHLSEAAHEDSYRKLRDWVRDTETRGLVDRIQILADGGKALYTNQQEGSAWVEPTLGLKALDDHRERRLTARELADVALRWQDLAQRFTASPNMPAEVVSQVVAWRNEANARAQTDPDAAALLELGLIARAFMAMDRHQFVREFPKFGKAADRMHEAIVYADKHLHSPEDRERFLAQARERLAERIAEGRFTPGRSQGTREPHTR